MDFRIPSQPNSELDRNSIDEFVESNLFRLILLDVPSQFWPKWVSRATYSADSSKRYPLLVKMFRSTNTDLCSIMRSCKFTDEPAQREHLETCQLCLLHNSEFNFHGVSDGLQEFVTSFLVTCIIDAIQSLNTEKVLITLLRIYKTINLKTFVQKAFSAILQ